MADAAPATAPTQAIGYTQAPLAQWWMYENEQTPELQWPNSVFVYDQMRRTDNQCKAVLKAVTLPVLGTPWRIDPAGARPEVVQLVADDLGLPILGQPLLIPARQRGRFSWDEHVRHALLCLVFGHSFFEQVYRVEDDGSLAHLAKLEYRPPSSIERIDVARDGGLVAIKQHWTETNTSPKPIPVDRLVAYAYEREGGNWLGQALALDTPIATPDGWTIMGELKPGDRVFDETGAVCSVTAVRKWTDRPTFRVTFDDGEEIVADANHQWLSYARVGQKRRPKVVTTAQMAASVMKYGDVNHAVTITGALDLPEADLPVDPYVLGAWLGDGSQSGGLARICDAEGEVSAEIERRGYQVSRLTNWETTRSCSIRGLATGLRVAGLLDGSARAGTIAVRKFVPAAYLRASAAQRLDLLRGLMDTDGHFDSANGQCIFSNTNKVLVDAVVELANSLGAKTKVQYVRQAGSVGYLKSGAAIHSRKDIYRVKFTARFIAFTMERKAKLQDLDRAAKRPYHYVRAVEVHSTQDTVCIEVSSASHLYLCGVGMKPTHNSLLRPAYKNWVLKDRLLRVQAQTIERNGMGIPVYEAQDGASPSDMDKGAAMAQAWRSGESAGSATPFGAKLRLAGVEGTLPDAKPVIEYHDDAIARAVLAHFLNLGGASQTGSWALGTTFADFFTLSLQAIAKFIANVATAHIIEDLVDVNWGPDEPAPRLCFDEIGSRSQLTAEALGILVDKGIIKPDEVLDGHVRQVYGLPPADPGTETPAPEDTGGGEVVDESAPTEMGTYSVAASAGVDLEDEASWIAAAAGVDTHPGGERLKKWWVYGGGAARWATWTELFDQLKDHIKNRSLLKRTVSAWYRLRYGHNPPRHHVTASALTGSPEALAAYAEEFGGTDGVDDEAEDWDLAIDALSAALDELSGAVSASFNPRQARNPKGSPGGGRFRSMVETLKDAIEHHRTTGAAGHPFASFDREQLRRVARKRGINLERGESKDSIAAKLLADLRGGPANSRAEKLAERQSTAGQKAAGVGVRKPSKAREERLRRLEEQTNAALDELDRKGPPVTGTAALTAPPLKLSQMTASGDPRAAALWFRTGDNSLDTRSGMPGFVELNRHMRGQVLGGPEMDARVADIESAMADSKLTRPIVVYRGMDTYELGSIGELEGVEFSDRAFASATTDEAHAKNFGTVLRITVPSGVGAIRMADRDPDRFTESEILLDRDLKYRIVAERIERNERGRISKHELDVEVIA